MFLAYVTSALTQKSVVRAEDLHGCNPSAGIAVWQTVWIEPVKLLHIQKLKCKPDVDKNDFQFRTFLNQEPNGGI